jgi:hypothetical protein
MAEAQLVQQIESLKAELVNLKRQLQPNVATPTVAKDLSLVSFIPKWTGTDKSLQVNEFFQTVESTANIGNWSEKDKIQITILRLADTAKAFYSGCLELHAPDITWEKFKAQFLKRFRDVRNDQFHFLQLQTARQKYNEKPQEFADRCRSLAQKTVEKVDDPVLQKCHYDQAERMMLAAFISGLIGNPGQQVRFKMPQTLEEALQIAITVYEAEIQEKRNETFYSGSVPKCSYCKRTGHTLQECRTKWRNSGQGNSPTNRESKFWKPNQTQKRVDKGKEGFTKAQLRCYECDKLGHFASECYRRKAKNRENKGNYSQYASRQSPQNSRNSNKALENKSDQGNE